MGSEVCDECGEPIYFQGLRKCHEHARRETFAGKSYVFYSEGTRIWASQRAQELRRERLIVIEVHDAYAGGAELWVRRREE
ncbi:MAG: hypothetical protein ACE5KH_01570 [Candidatus Geothermarchaeales archaeon]